MALIVALVIVAMSILLGAEQGPKVDPTTTTYTPRPEWYFFFLFELLRVIKPPGRCRSRRSGSRPSAWSCCSCCRSTTATRATPRAQADRHHAGILTIIAMAYLTFLGATAGPPSEIDLKTSPPRSSPARRSWPSRAASPATSSATTATTAPARS